MYVRTMILVWTARWVQARCGACAIVCAWSVACVAPKKDLMSYDACI
jgi:hypothetical protein